MYSLKRQFGNRGEDIACMFLLKRGFKIIERNYLRKCGEIDIVATKNGIFRFIEVKSVSHVTGNAVSGETLRPEENLHPGKMRRLQKTIEVYLLEKNIETDWQIDLVTVQMDMTKGEARVEMLENIIM